MLMHPWVQIYLPAGPTASCMQNCVELMTLYSAIQFITQSFVTLFSLQPSLKKYFTNFSSINI